VPIAGNWVAPGTTTHQPSTKILKTSALFDLIDIFGHSQTEAVTWFLSLRSFETLYEKPPGNQSFPGVSNLLPVEKAVVF